MAMTVRINGREFSLAPDATLVAVFNVLTIPRDRQGIAIAVNGAVIPRSEWEKHRIRESDAIEVVTAAQGG